PAAAPARAPPRAPREPMLAKAIDALPPADGFLFEPKWDGFRAIVFRPARGEIAIQSRDLRPLDRSFPELDDALVARWPDGSIVDGEIVVVGDDGLDFDALQQRLHPAASRVAQPARATPASLVRVDRAGAARARAAPASCVAFALRPAPGRSLLRASQSEGRAALEQLLEDASPPLHL